MCIDLYQPAREVREQTDHARFGHRARPGNTEHVVRDDYATTPCSRPEQPRPGRGEQRARMSDVGFYASQNAYGLARHSHRPQPVAATDLQDLRGGGRMHVEVLVGVHVIQRQARAAKSLELRCDLGGKLAPYRGAKVYVQGSLGHAASETPRGIDQIGQVVRLKHRMPVNQHNVQPHAQRGHAACPHHRISGSGRPDHEARGGDNAGPVGDLHRLVDFVRASEIVCGDDQRLQCTNSRRSRRKWKNSTPSRNRRRIICGLTSISPTIEAILFARR